MLTFNHLTTKLFKLVFMLYMQLVVSLAYVCLVELKDEKKERPVKRRSMQIHVDTRSPTEPLGSKSVSIGI